jgi:hypothetical protein
MNKRELAVKETVQQSVHRNRQGLSPKRWLLL